jgi:magnesium transporter
MTSASPDPADAREQLVTELEALLARPDRETLRTRLEGLHPADLAAAVAGLEAAQQLILFETLPAPLASRVLTELDDLSCKHLVQDLAEPRVTELIDAMAPEMAVHVLEHLPEAERSRIVAALRERLRTQVQERLSYPKDSAGRIMSVVVPKVRGDLSVAEATEELRRRFGDRESIDAVFAVDDSDRLLGQLSPLRLLLAAPQVPVRRLILEKAPTIAPETDQEQAAEVAIRYDLVALPVTDPENRLLGMVSFYDVYDVIEEEDVEDLSFAAGTGADAPTERTAARAIRARLPWLIVGLVGGLGSAGVLSHFESSLQRLVSLAFFVPVVLGLAGGVAVQSSSLAVRGLATGSISPRRLPAVAWRELRVSIGMGLALGALLGIAAFALSGGDASLGVALFVVLLLVLATAAIGGTLVPIALAKLGIDPAVAMGPFVTTLSDLVALAIYLSVASTLVGS